MIERIYVDNYKCLVNFELRLTPLSLIVGANGVGKSAILDMLASLRSLLDGTARITDPGMFTANTRTRWQIVPRQIFEMDVRLEEDLYTYRLEIQHDDKTHRARIDHETLTVDGRPLFAFQAGDVHLYRDDHSVGPTYPADWSESALARITPRADNRRLTAFRAFVRRIIVCGLYPHSFDAESPSEMETLSRTGENFSSWYRHTLQEHQDLMPEYIEALRDIIDGFSGIRMERVGSEARVMMAVFRNGDVKFELRLDELSDGQRGVLALYALLHLTAGQGFSLFLDEPDNYIALPELQPWLLALSRACGDTLTQAVVCSHHPELIDYLGPESGLALEREASGVTRVRPLADLAPDDALKLSEAIARGWTR